MNITFANLRMTANPEQYRLKCSKMYCIFREPRCSISFYYYAFQFHSIYTKISSEYPENLKTDFAPAYIESLIEITTENLKKSTSGIEKQNISQEKILRSLLEMNEFLNSNIEISKQMRDELKILSKTISNTLNKN